MSGTPAGKSGRQLTELKSRRFSAPSRARGVRRPEEISRDVRGLKLRQRVSLILNDKTVRDELEDIVSSYYQNGPRPGNEGFRTYQDFLLPTSFHGGGQVPSAIIPIADIRGTGTLNYSKQERSLRCKLASVYRLIDHFGWNRSMYEHSSARSSSEEGSFLLNPFGLLNHEITASSLVRVDNDGNIKDGGSTNLGVNVAGVVQHSAIYEARKDIKAVIHMHSPTIAAVSIMKCGLLPLTTESSLLGEITYHDYHGLTLDKAEKESIAKDLGEKSFVMILRNHGTLVCGESVEAAFRKAHLLERACQFQINAMSAGIDNIIKLDEDVVRQVQESGHAIDQSGRGPNMKLDEKDFEAWMRMLDSMGCKTGYNYRNPEVFLSEKRDVPEVTSPATTTSLRQNLFNTPDRQQVRRAHSTGRANTYRNRVKWLNTPVKSTEYKKEKAELIEQPEPVTVKDSQPERPDKDAVQAVEEAMEQVKISVTESAPVDEEKGAHDAETREHREYKKTVVVTRITKSDDGEEETTTHTTTTHVVNGEDVGGLKPPSLEELDKSDGEQTEGSEDMLDQKEGEHGESSEPGSPNKKGKKVHKSHSFKDKFKKMIGKKEKSEKRDGEKATAEKAE